MGSFVVFLFFICFAHFFLILYILAPHYSLFFFIFCPFSLFIFQPMFLQYMSIISFSVNPIQTLSICIKQIFPSNPYFSPYYLKMYISNMPLVNYFRILVISIKYFVQKVHVVKHSFLSSHFIRQFQRYLFLAKNFHFSNACILTIRTFYFHFYQVSQVILMSIER